jgi:hypothetical protein
MQQSFNFGQLHEALSGKHGSHVWRAAFDGSNELIAISERRLELRRAFNDTILTLRVRKQAIMISCSGLHVST